MGRYLLGKVDERARSRPPGSTYPNLTRAPQMSRHSSELGVQPTTRAPRG
ncbi:MAG: hypothetical protein LM564_05850 [Desulfurococcaceae archaeon]|nr:hypothetical protein [Desulfurococcaceae archaeon]